MPKVEAFWSFTLHPNFSLVPSEINRRVIRENTKGLKWKADGMLRIPIQAQRSDDEQLSHRLARTAPFQTVR